MRSPQLFVGLPFWQDHPQYFHEQRYGQRLHISAYE